MRGCAGMRCALVATLTALARLLTIFDCRSSASFKRRCSAFSRASARKRSNTWSPRQRDAGGFLMPLRWGPEFLGVNMADEQAAQAVESTENTEAAQSDSVEALGEGGKKALDAERKRAAEAEKQAKALQAQIDALNDAKLTETERLQKQLDALTADYQAAQVDAARNRVAAEEQIPAGLVGYLAGE